jgi:hypothetical protein
MGTFGLQVLRKTIELMPDKQYLDIAALRSRSPSLHLHTKCLGVFLDESKQPFSLQPDSPASPQLIPEGGGRVNLPGQDLL